MDRHYNYRVGSVPSMSSVHSYDVSGSVNVITFSDCFMQFSLYILSPMGSIAAISLLEELKSVARKLRNNWLTDQLQTLFGLELFIYLLILETRVNILNRELGNIYIDLVIFTT